MSTKTSRAGTHSKPPSSGRPAQRRADDASNIKVDQQAGICALDLLILARICAKNEVNLREELNKVYTEMDRDPNQKPEFYAEDVATIKKAFQWT